MTFRSIVGLLLLLPLTVRGIKVFLIRRSGQVRICIFKDLFEICLEGDHYKWRAMRANGVAERYCTGDAKPFLSTFGFKPPALAAGIARILA